MLNNEMTMPKVIEDYIEASNKPDPAAFVACFADDAVVTDEGVERVGKSAIKKWSDENHFAYHVMLEPKKVRQNGGDTIVTCQTEGDYDKTGLPDPLYLDFYFHLKNEKIASLKIELA